MNLLDHSFVILIVVIYPIASFIGFRRLLRRVAAGEKVSRSQMYRNTMIGHWILFCMGIAIWAYAGRPWAAIGVSFDFGLWFGIGVILTILCIVALVMQNRQISASSPDELRSLRERLGDLLIIIPQNGNELARFYGLSVTAGIVEEVLWRGFLIWYFGQFMPLWAAALLSTIGFGLAHAYQGPKQLPHITAVGAAFAVLYLVSGSIWLPIILHAAVDILQGRMAYDVVYRSEFDTDTSGPGALRANAS